MTDPIGDLATRIRNACSARKTLVRVPYSRIKAAIAQILVQQHYLKAANLDRKENVLNLEIEYDKSEPVLSGIERVSKPGKRFYADADHIKVPLAGRGITILSTNKGIVANKQAKDKRLGGEVLLRVW